MLDLVLVTGVFGAGCYYGWNKRAEQIKSGLVGLLREAEHDCSACAAAVRHLGEEHREDG